MIHENVAKQRQAILFAVWCRTQELGSRFMKPELKEPIRKAARQILMRSMKTKMKPLF